MGSQLLKAPLRSLLDRLGYVVMKRSTFERIASGNSEERRAQSVQANARQLAELRKLGADQDLVRLVELAPAELRVPMDQAAALFPVLRRVLSDRVAGDVVDCGNGNPALLAFLGSALSFMGETSRRLVLFDVSGNPLERAETRLDSWGQRDDLLDGKVSRGAGQGHPPLPHDLQTSGYPPHLIDVLRKGSVRDVPAQIAVLMLTADAYPANCAAVQALLPRVTQGGAILVAKSLSALSHRDAVAEAMGALRIDLHFEPLGGSLRLAGAPKARPASA